MAAVHSGHQLPRPNRKQKKRNLAERPAMLGKGNEEDFQTKVSKFISLLLSFRNLQINYCHYYFILTTKLLLECLSVLNEINLVMSNCLFSYSTKIVPLKLVYLVLQDVTQYNLVLQDVTQYNLVLQDVTQYNFQTFN